MKALPHVLVATMIACPLARATEPGEPVRIAFRGEQGCPDKDAFMAGVRARSARVREAEPGEAARAFEVSLSRQADGRFHGELAVVEGTSANPAERARSIDGDSCEEVVDALALFTVLSVDPAAVLGEQAEGTGQVDDATVVPPPPLAPVAPEPQTAQATPPAAPPSPRHEEGSARKFRAVAGMHGGILAVGASAPLPAASLFAEFGIDDGGVPGLSFRPIARISLLATPETTITVSEGRARLRWTKLGLDLCPLVVRGTRTLAVSPCFTISEGLINASGEIAEPETVTAPFRTLGALVRTEWAVLDQLLLEVALGIEMPLTRDSFYFEPATTVYAVPPVIGVATLGGGFRFL